MHSREKRHRDQSLHNHKTYAYLAAKNPSYRDWEITVLFYSALHLVDTRAKITSNPKNHVARRRWIEDHMGPISNDYKKLQTLSEKSRYKPVHHLITQDEVRKAVRLYESIKKYVESKHS